MKKIFLPIILIFALGTCNFAQQGHVHSHEKSNHDHEHLSQSHECENLDHDHDDSINTHNHSSTIEKFKTQAIEPRTFIRTIYTTGMIRIVPKNEWVITASSAGIINFLSGSLVEGIEVVKGQTLFSLSGNNMIDENPALQFIHTKNAYLQSLENFNRAKHLIQEKIISSKEFQERKLKLAADSAAYWILKRNYHSESLTIQSSISGRLYKLFVQNGEYVEAGQKLAIVTGEDNHLLEVSLPKKYFSNLQKIGSGTFKMEYDKQFYSFTSTARISYANRITSGSPYIPVLFNIENKNLLPGSFAEVWLNVEKKPDSIVIPKSALIEQQGLYFVFKEVAENDFLKVRIQVEAINAHEAKISSGLHVGDEILIGGVLEMKLLQSTGAIDPHAGHNH
ncbi:MAG: efflux RND transporter periplasmic adaptor subunit [Candidatus Marinimicrobia bacterium]|nr:efflux RND transporter periplasmic adaptor subunit [Candidatus Neomarinimicrobiota bacterium]